MIESPTWLRPLLGALRTEGRLLADIERILVEQHEAVVRGDRAALEEAASSGYRLLGTVRRHRFLLEVLGGLEADGPPASEADAEGGACAARVLIAEDDEVSATILTHRMRKEGLEVVRYRNGQLARDAALADPPDLVILDIKMPGLDGFEVLKGLRGDPRFGATPIIMLTSTVKEAEVVRGLELGADDYIRKPFSPTELSARVRRLLRKA